jgi:hypothetical protein
MNLAFDLMTGGIAGVFARGSILTSNLSFVSDTYQSAVFMTRRWEYVISLPTGLTRPPLAWYNCHSPYEGTADTTSTTNFTFGIVQFDPWVFAAYGNSATVFLEVTTTQVKVVATRSYGLNGPGTLVLLPDRIHYTIFQQ